MKQLITVRDRKKRIGLAIIFAIFAILITWVVYQNTAVELNTITVKCKNLPDSFSGMRIAHISDLHNAEFGNKNDVLLEMLIRSEPDIIAISGDLVDSRRTNFEVAINFAKEAVNIAPTYYITGNHESRLKDYEILEDRLLQAGVTVLRDTKVILRRGEDIIELAGLEDPGFARRSAYFSDNTEVLVAKKLKGLVKDESFTILLSHRPEPFDVYVQNHVDVVLAGHAHGGQFRIPFIGGLFSPDQGFFPKYDSGLYTDERTNMIVSRGLGNSLLPLRVNNPPEILTIILE